jgi:hypothetical protein
MVARFEPVGGWMHFAHLDGGLAYVDGMYTLAWRLTDQAGDAWTRRIDQFKFVSNAASLKGAHAALVEALPNLMSAKSWEPGSTGILAALNSPDMRTVPTKPLPTTVATVAAKLGLKSLPTLLSKQPHRQLHTLKGYGERGAELVKAKYQAAAVPGGIRRVLVLDEIATRGETIDHIAAAIRKASPTVRVIGVCLGKSERQSYAASCGYEISNDHVPRVWGERWDNA